VEWTDEPTASNTNQRLVTVIEDPYKDDCGHNSPLTLSQLETLSLPPPSSGAYYYSTVPPTSPSSFPSSSYSALSGWDGDYKPQQASMRSWPESQPLPNAPHTSSTVSWYSDQELYNWTEVVDQGVDRYVSDADLLCFFQSEGFINNFLPAFFMRKGADCHPPHAIVLPREKF
jgi:hypothetical protein